MPKFIYNIIKYPLIFIFIKTPLIEILKKRFKFRRFSKKPNIFFEILDKIFQKEYIFKLKDKNKIRELTNSTLEDGEGKKWALHWYNKHFETLDELEKRKVGLMFADQAAPNYKRLINYLKKNNLQENEDIFIIQLGSCSGRDLEFFLKIFPKLKYISTDVNDEILNFQKSKYNYSNLFYFKCHAENIDLCIQNFKLEEKKIILFSHGSLQFVNPYFLKEFFNKISNYKNLNLFLHEPIDLRFIDNNTLISQNRANVSFSHRYDVYAKTQAQKIIQSEIIRPYSSDDKFNRFTGSFIMHSVN